MSLSITPECILFGNSHVNLVTKIFSKLNLRFPDDKLSNCTYFSNDEVRPQIRHSIRGKTVYIIQTGASTLNNIKGKQRSINDFVMETLLLISTCKRSNASRIVLIMPHFPYARQDKKDSPRAAISASDVCRLLYDCGVDEIISFDLHNSAIQGFAKKSFNNIPCFKIIKEKLESLIGNDHDKFCLGAPDESASLEISKYSSGLGIPMVYFSKRRDYKLENVVSESRMIGDKKYIEGKTVVLIDDMIDTAGTMCKAAEILVSKGALDILIIATHGIFSYPAMERLNKCDAISKIYVSDSIPQTNNIKICPKIREFSIAGTIADIMTRIHNNKSVSESSCFFI